jgi:hypothetical protein
VTHSDPKLNGATFQAASQFNCLEFASADGVPEKGIAVYELDCTQGPACAIACAASTASTAYRNYLVRVNRRYHRATEEGDAAADEAPQGVQQAGNQLNTTCSTAKNS